jgi:hypothetical protein
MRTAVTLARRHEATSWELLAGPDVPLLKQQEAFKKVRMSPANADFAEVSFREDGAQARNYRLVTPAKAKADAEAKAKAEQAAPPKPAAAKPQSKPNSK